MQQSKIQELFPPSLILSSTGPQKKEKKSMLTLAATDDLESQLTLWYMFFWTENIIYSTHNMLEISEAECVPVPEHVPEPELVP